MNGSPFRHCPRCGVGNHPQAQACQQCGSPFNGNTVVPQPPASYPQGFQPPGVDRRKLALGLMIGGGLLAAFFMFVFSIAAPGTNIVNEGLMNDRMVGSIFGGLMAVVGAILYATSPSSPPLVRAPQATAAAGPKPPFVFPRETLWIPALVLTIFIVAFGTIGIVRLINAGYAAKRTQSEQKASSNNFRPVVPLGSPGIASKARTVLRDGLSESEVIQKLGPPRDVTSGDAVSVRRLRWEDNSGKVAVSIRDGQVSGWSIEGDSPTDDQTL